MDIMKCTSITTDGAAAMRGEDKGLVTRLVKHIEQNRSPELALFINTDIYCFSHKENLCVVALLKDCHLHFIYRVIKWFSLSTTCKRWKIYVIDKNLKQIPIPSTIRWDTSPTLQHSSSQTLQILFLSYPAHPSLIQIKKLHTIIRLSSRRTC